MDVDAEASAVDETPGKYSARKKAETKTTVVLPSERVQPATFFFPISKISSRFYHDVTLRA